ncbi:hypothetical protein DPMN_068314 [Dreissena polymorpha]|uniref:Uncharacterized protein n=1 Tax=Dreissena polymorpha TaxID=45954 RepID=A0A9D3YWX8_DREPO|nr:hypothetical protein DPMN_068314 [Dreissena polymorpha]
MDTSEHDSSQALSKNTRANSARSDVTSNQDVERHADRKIQFQHCKELLWKLGNDILVKNK